MLISLTSLCLIPTFGLANNVFNFIDIFRYYHLCNLLNLIHLLTIFIYSVQGFGLKS